MSDRIERATAKLEALRLLVSEQSLEVRARREPEHIYTASLIGALGALAWGVATVSAIPHDAPIPIYRHPAIVGMISAWLLGTFVLRKILREHGIYVVLRGEQNKIIARMAHLHGLPNKDLPRGLQIDQPTDGPGYIGAQKIILAGIAGITLFCLSIYLI